MVLIKLEEGDKGPVRIWAVAPGELRSFALLLIASVFRFDMGVFPAFSVAWHLKAFMATKWG